MTLEQNPLYQAHMEVFQLDEGWLENGGCRYITVRKNDGDYLTLCHNKVTGEVSYIGKPYKYKGKADKQTAAFAEGVAPTLQGGVIEEKVDEHVMKTEKVAAWNKPTRLFLAFKVLTVIHQYATNGEKFDQSELEYKRNVVKKADLDAYVRFHEDYGQVFIGKELVAQFDSYEDARSKIKVSRFIKLAKQAKKKAE
jgi:hypothetical protein